MTDKLEHLMGLALEQARLAAKMDDVPVGAIVVDENDNIVFASGNRRQQDHDPSAHAEILALKGAAKKRGHWNLTGWKMFVTLEPCPMCAGAIVNARIDTLIYAASDTKGGAISLKIPILENPRLNHRVKIKGGVLADEARELLQSFFQQKRKKHSERE